MKREAFNFYRSYYEVLEDIRRPEDKLTYLMALLDRQFRGIEPNLVDIPKLVYNSQKHSIDKQVKGWEDKTKTPLYDPYQHPTEGGSQGGYEGSGEGGMEHPSYPKPKNPSGDSATTTEGVTEPPYQPPTEHPYLQEQEKGQEKEEEQEQEEVKDKLTSSNNISVNTGADFIEVDVFSKPSTIKKYLDDGYKVVSNGMEWTYSDIEDLLKL